MQMVRLVSLWMAQELVAKKQTASGSQQVKQHL